MDFIEFLTLWELVKGEGVVDEVARKLGIKPSSLKRQVNRIIAYHQGLPVQKRSGSKSMVEYAKAMRSTLEAKLNRPVITSYFETQRKVVFSSRTDALAYSQPIAHISSIRYENEEWVIRIVPDSSLLPFIIED
jgi:transposase-like protein